MTRPPLIILAGGKGTRLGELTRELPKPMVLVNGRPFLYWLIEHYRKQGFQDITISTGYKAEIIEKYYWPEGWNLEFIRDGGLHNPDRYYKYSDGCWIVNGDTFIPEKLPYVTTPTILSCNDVDAGAQFTGRGKIQIYPVSEFYDMGTPKGLKAFENYFTNVSSLTQIDPTPECDTLVSTIGAKERNV